jgi:hypothetical protein
VSSARVVVVIGVCAVLGVAAPAVGDGTVAARTGRSQAQAAITDPDELAARQAAVDRHLLRVQQARFEAEARGDDPRRLDHLGRAFRRTQERRRDLARAAAAIARTD